MMFEQLTSKEGSILKRIGRGIDLHEEASSCESYLLATLLDI